MNKNKERKIPIVIITRMNGDEFGDRWGQQAKGIWILSNNKIEEFNNVMGVKYLSWYNFANKSLNIIEEDISALVLNGHTNDKKPHQLEVIWHLLFKENYFSE